MNYTITQKPIFIDNSVKKTCLSFRGCCGGHGMPSQGSVIRIRSAGTCRHLIEYPAEIDGENICFEWDDLIYHLDCGRYIGDIFEPDKQCDNKPIGSLQFEVGDRCYQVGFEVFEDDDTPKCQPPKCDSD